MKRLLVGILGLITSILSVRGEQEEILLSSTFPKAGTVRVPVLLCAFPDQGFVVEDPNTAFSNMMNVIGYSDNHGTGSVREYYLISSDNFLDLRFDVYGPYVVSHNLEYYGANSGTSHSKNAQELVKEMINLAGNDGVDFSLYDADNDGVVDNVSVFFAGHNEAEGGDENTLWPHQSFVSGGPTWNKKTFGSYLITSELRGATGSIMAGIGTYCHEFGHVLGLPDLYNTNNNTSDEKVYTVGDWDVMCHGSYNNSGRTPPLYSAFERFMMGWHNPTQLRESGIYTLPPMATTDSAFLIALSDHSMDPNNISPAEFFLIENRQRTGWEGRHEDCLPGVGLLISHVTYNARTWSGNTFNNATPLGYDLCEAYNQNPTQSSPYDTYPGTMNVTTFTPVMNGGDSITRYRLHNILQRNSGLVSFAFGDTPDARFTFSPTELDTFVTTFDEMIADYTPQTLTVTGSNLTSSTVSLAFANAFFSLAADGSWQRPGDSFIDTVRPDGSYSRTLQLRFEPRRQSCIPTSSSLQVFSGDSTAFALLSVVGISPRPNYLTKPDSLTASEIETTDFRVDWTEVDDADYYIARAWFHDATSGQYNLISERMVYAPTDHAYLTELTANTTYLVNVTAYDEKSCSLHSFTSDSLFVTTAIDVDIHKAMPVIQNADGTCTLVLPTAAEAEMTVYLFAIDGRLIATIPVAEGTERVNIPVDGLVPNQLYLIKYVPAGTFPRKAHFAKFIYHS